jgi:hypothetical protein
VTKRIEDSRAASLPGWERAEPVGSAGSAAREFEMSLVTLLVRSLAQNLHVTKKNGEPVRRIVEGLPLGKPWITQRTGLLGGTRSLSRGTAPGMWLRAIHRVNLLAD